MKKYSFILLLAILSSNGIAQNKGNTSTNLENKAVDMILPLTGNEVPVIIKESNVFTSPHTSRDLGIPIGITYYDMQSNWSNCNKMLVFPDGSINAVWTMAPNSTAGYPERGTGFNRSTNNGQNWLPEPTVRIEGAVRTGWPCVGKLTNGSLIVTSHASNQGNLCKSTNNGSSWVNSYIESTSLGLIWCRMVTNGNTIHLIGHTSTTTPYGGFDLGALVYLRSTNSGINWTTPVIPTGLDASNYMYNVGFNDRYCLANKGDTIAIVYGDGFRTPCLVKSTNNGNTWAYREILHLPVKMFNTQGTTRYDINSDNQQDNVYCTDGVHYAVIDNTGKVHVFFGRMKYTDDGVGAGYQFFPYTDGLYYWNEDKGTIQYQYKWTMIGTTNTYEAIPDTVNFPIITKIKDINNNGIIDFPNNGANPPFGPYFCSLSSQPAAVITPDGSITLFYSSIVEGTDGTVGPEHRAFRNIWEIHKMSGLPSAPWSAPVRIAADDYTEEVYPSVSPVLTKTGNNNYSHLWYQADNYPGNALQPLTGNPHTIVENTIYYIKYNTAFVNINDKNSDIQDIAIYPIPANDKITINLQGIMSYSDLNLYIYNLQGQLLIQKKLSEQTTEINLSQLPAGIYIAKLQLSNGSFAQKKFVVMK
jgi:hypothetical protein